MKKAIIPIIIIIGLIILGAIVSVAIKRGNEKIIQGEVETKTVDLSVKIAGRVKCIHVKKGDIVQKGQLLVTLDMPEIEAKSEQTNAGLDVEYAKEQMSLNSLKQAQAGAELARKTYERLNNLYKEGVIPAQKLDEAKAKYIAAKEMANAANKGYNSVSSASIRRAKGAVSEVSSYLRENTIKSPITGQITEINVDEGELVGSGYPVITVVSNDDNWLVFNLREDYLQKVKIGTVFDVKIPAISDKPISVKVNYISALGNYATWRATRIRGDFDLKTFEVRAVPTEKVDGLRAGMTAVVDWNKVK